MLEAIGEYSESVKGCVSGGVRRLSAVTVAVVAVFVLAIVLMGLVLGKQFGPINSLLNCGVIVVCGCSLIGVFVFLLTRRILAYRAARKAQAGGFSGVVSEDEKKREKENVSSTRARDSKKRKGEEDGNAFSTDSSKTGVNVSDGKSSLAVSEELKKKQKLDAMLKCFEQYQSSVEYDQMLMEHFFQQSFGITDLANLSDEEFGQSLQEFFNELYSYTGGWAPSFKSEFAQTVFSFFLWKVGHVKASFVNLSQVSKARLALSKEFTRVVLDKSVFSYRQTNGLDKDIEWVWSNKKGPVHIFQIEGSFHGLVGGDRQDMPALGKVTEERGQPLSQGSLVQRKNPRVFEGTGLLAHGGFNGLALVIFRNSFEKEDLSLHGDPFPVAGGRLRLTEKNVKQVAEVFTKAVSKLRCPCFDLPHSNPSFERRPQQSVKEIQSEYEKDFENKPRVKLVVQSAPDSSGLATSGSLDPSLEEARNRIEESNFFTNVAIMFEVAIKEAREQFNTNSPYKGVHVHLIGLGQGVFANQEKNFERGFLRAVSEYQYWLICYGIQVTLDYLPGEGGVLAKIAQDNELLECQE